jgi:hypothetical protein
MSNGDMHIDFTGIHAMDGCASTLREDEVSLQQCVPCSDDSLLTCFIVNAKRGWLTPTESSVVALVTFVHTKSYCEESKNLVLLAIVVVGAMASILVNLPFLLRVHAAFARYIHRLYVPEGTDNSGLPPMNTTFRHERLRLFQSKTLFAAIMTTSNNDNDSESADDSSTLHSEEVASLLTTTCRGIVDGNDDVDDCDRIEEDGIWNDRNAKSARHIPSAIELRTLHHRKHKSF